MQALFALIAFLAALSPLLANMNVWIIRTIYKTQGGDYYSKQWHAGQWFVLAAVFAFVFYLDWRAAIVWPFYHWIVFDGIINYFAFRDVQKRPFFYVGNSSAIDKAFQRTGNPVLVMATFKLLLLAGAVAAAIFIKWDL